MFGQMADIWFLELLNAGFAASAAVLVVLLLRLPLRRAPKLYSYLLWAPVLFRLLCPFPIESVFSLLPARAQPIPQDILTARTPRIETGVAVLDRTVNAALPAGEAAGSVNPLQVWLWAAQIVWLAGAAGLLLYSVIAAQRLRRRLRGAVREEKNIYSAAGLETPFVMGLFRPRIYLPAGLADVERRYILLHEQTHIRRGDHLWRLLGFLALCLHWYNPLVWLAFSMSGRDMEMSCDEAVLRVLGEDVKKPYSASLLALASGRRWVGGTPLAFGEGDTGARIKNVLRYRRPAFWVSLALLAAVAAAAVGLALSPRSGREGEDASSSPPAQVSSSGAQAQPEPSASAPTTAEPKPVLLTEETANGVIRQTLSTLTLGSDDTVSFRLPQSIPTDENKKTELFISLSATFSDEVGTYSIQNIFDTKSGWQGGEQRIEKLDVGRGKLTRVFMRVAFMTKVSETAHEIYAADYVELSEPFQFDTPVNIVERSVEISSTGATSTLHYTMQNGDSFKVSLSLPDGVTLSTSENYPEYAATPDHEMPAVVAVKAGVPIGILTLGEFGTEDKDTLTQIDTTKNEIPMPIFAGIALSNHAAYENYKVCRSSFSGANATAKYLWQDLTGYGGNAPDAPWLRSDSILAYDYEKIPFFISLNLTDSSLSAEELENLAESIVIMS